MKIILLAVGTKMPGWVQEGFNDYQKRFPSEMKLVLEEIPPVKRYELDDLYRCIASGVAE